MTFAERRDAARMTATERLRQLLDERGVEWYARNILSTAYVHWGDDRKGPTFDAKDAGGGKVDLFCYRISPEQAVEATLGRGTCRMTLADLRGPAYTDVYECSECGHQTMVYTVMGESEPPRYCPECGRKVEE